MFASVISYFPDGISIRDGFREKVCLVQLGDVGVKGVGSAGY